VLVHPGGGGRHGGHVKISTNDGTYKIIRESDYQTLNEKGVKEFFVVGGE
jgi:hypothetical protein